MNTDLRTFIFGIMGGLLGLGGYIIYDENQPENPISIKEHTAPVIQTSNLPTYSTDGEIDFSEAASKTVDAVVHVKNRTVTSGPRSFSDLYYGRSREREQVGTGSGVIVTPDGYIITNNHVIEGATELQVTLNNNRTYTAKLVGTDPVSDIALIRIDADKDLPYLAFGDSNNVKVGEWVLAIGNPFNLTSTVTAGIISAKGRDLSSSDARMQSFIQTDAAVNPGNSGGALVNTRGELVGINTAITSKTGSYIGYSFAVPSNNARKIIEDIMEYGSVQKGVLGISGYDLNGRLADQLDINETEGIMVNDIMPESGAENSKLAKGDVIKEIDNIHINKFADLTGYVGTKNPGDEVALKVLRDGEMITIPLKLSKKPNFIVKELDLEVRNLLKEEKKSYKLKNGVKIIRPVGELAKDPRSKSLIDFAIVSINDQQVNDTDQLRSIMADTKPGEILSIEMVSPRGESEQLRFRR